MSWSRKRATILVNTSDCVTSMRAILAYLVGHDVELELSDDHELLELLELDELLELLLVSNPSVEGDELLLLAVTELTCVELDCELPAELSNDDWVDCELLAELISVELD